MFQMIAEMISDDIVLCSVLVFEEVAVEESRAGSRALATVSLRVTALVTASMTGLSDRRCDNIYDILMSNYVLLHKEFGTIVLQLVHLLSFYFFMNDQIVLIINNIINACRCYL